MWLQHGLALQDQAGQAASDKAIPSAAAAVVPSFLADCVRLLVRSVSNDNRNNKYWKIESLKKAHAKHYRSTGNSDLSRDLSSGICRQRRPGVDWPLGGRYVLARGENEQHTRQHDTRSSPSPPHSFVHM